jgi:hypothetical protein
MPVEMIIDQWNPRKRRYRTETFCYRPRSCPIYEAGPARKVPARHGMTYTEEDWLTLTRLHTAASTSREVTERLTPRALLVLCMRRPQ